MAILKIARMGHPILMGKAQEVDDPTSPQVRKLVSDMVETMLDAPGVGLAAPQVHVAARIVVYRVPAELDETDMDIPVTVLINPTIQPLSDLFEEGVEGCLSLPDMAGIVPRYKHIRFRAFDLKGKEIERDVEGYHARVVQHECDHLDGILYPMRMNDLSKLGYADEIAKTTIEFDNGKTGVDKEIIDV